MWRPEPGSTLFVHSGAHRDAELHRWYPRGFGLLVSYLVGRPAPAGWQWVAGTVHDERGRPVAGTRVVMLKADAVTAVAIVPEAQQQSKLRQQSKTRQGSNTRQPPERTAGSDRQTTTGHSAMIHVHGRMYRRVH